VLILHIFFYAPLEANIHAASRALKISREIFNGFLKNKIASLFNRF